MPKEQKKCNECGTLVSEGTMSANTPTTSAGDWEEEFDKLLTDCLIDERGKVSVRVEMPRLFKSFLRSLLSSSKQQWVKELRGKVEKAEIAEDKVGTFKDGHDALKAQLLALLDNEGKN